MPPPAPLAMPVQDLRRAPPRRSVPRADVRTLLARLVAFGGATLLTALAGAEMRDLMGADALDALSITFLVLFALTFGWIAFSACSAMAGLLHRPRRARPPAGAGDSGPTAVIMPIYFEDPAAVTARLEAMVRDLDRIGAAAGFEIVVLSDTTGADAWVRETAAVDRLARAVGNAVPVHYRRRDDNAGKKAGNVANFVRRWGGRYPHMVVLDADSLMAGDTLVAMRAAMQAEPDLGLLQSVPRLVGATTPFARMQQFAGSLYSPIAARGVAAWSGSDGNYWGHNAIIRTAAFAEACGLPELRGRAPFGGHILSHDFVEAALMRRAGWRVEMDPDLVGSHEEGPPTVTDAIMRDRRWAQGNLQHAAVLGTRGLRWPSRAHMMVGIGSYLASPLWLLSVLVGLTMALRVGLAVPDYFPDAFQLHPTWPSFDPLRMGWLLAVTLALAFVPKLLGVVRGLLVPAVRRAHGGATRLLRSAGLEVTLAMLLAPVVMALQTRDVASILLGRSIGWAPQRREARAGTGWHMAMHALARPFAWPTVLGMAVGIGAALVSLPVLMWLSPFVIGLLLAVPLAAWTGDAVEGLALARRGWLDTPEALDPPAVMREMERLVARNAALPVPVNVGELAARAHERERHFRWVEPSIVHRGVPLADRLTARAKLEDAETREEALAWLTEHERVQTALDPALCERLGALPPTADATSSGAMAQAA